MKIREHRFKLADIESSALRGVHPEVPPGNLAAEGQLLQVQKPRGALQAAYGEAFRRLLDGVQAGDDVVFAAVRGPKVRVTVRLSQALCDRLREALGGLNLKVTDFACTALDRYLAQLEGS